MKLKSTLWALAFACAAVSCSDELEGGPNGGDGTLSGEKGYAKIAINLPTTSGVSTRVDNGNDSFDDGTLAEYTVNDAYLLIFDGDGDNASLSSWYQLNHGFSDSEDATGNITVTSTITQEIVPPQSGNAYALVVLNNNNVLTFNGTQVEDITDSGDAVTYNSETVSTWGSLYAALSTDVSTFTGANENSFTMTNAPISDYAGNQSTELASATAGFVHTLVQLNIYPNEDQALAASGDPIYVERVVAKVTVDDGVFTNLDSNTNQYYAVVESDNNYDGDKVYLDGWYLNVTNKSTKFVRDVEDATIPDYMDWKGYQNATSNQSSVNRFFGTSSNPYRVYWAIDPNYNNFSSSSDETALKAAFNIYGEDDYNAPYVMGSDLFTKPVYCLENTFATTNMYKRETTGIVFRMTYVMGDEDPQTFFIMGDVATSEPQYATEFVEAVNTALNGQSFTVELKSSAKGGYYDTAAEIKNLFQKASAGGDLDDTEAEAVLKACDGMIRVYENGTTYYYAAQIEHFGDTYCAYTSGVYDAEKHLGRYGVVRNNWYELSITSISGPGRPTPPDPTDPDDPDNPDPDDPDDGGSQWIAFNVNVLSWAKREQSIDF